MPGASAADGARRGLNPSLRSPADHQCNRAGRFPIRRTEGVGADDDVMKGPAIAWWLQGLAGGRTVVLAGKVWAVLL